MKKNNRSMYQYSYSTTEMGVSITITFCAWTWKDVCALLNINMYTAKNYVTRYKPKDQICIDNPLLRFAYYDSGEFFRAYPTGIRKLYKYIDLCAKINEHRQIYKTYRDTEIAIENNFLTPQ